MLKEHSALEAASFEMLNALEIHGQGCALIHFSPRQSNSQETKNEKLSTNLNNANFPDSNGTTERNQMITLLASNQKLNQLI